MSILETSMHRTGCWGEPGEPSAELMQWLGAHGVGMETGAASKRPVSWAAKVRRDVVDRAVIYIGTGTCGLGAGAAETLRAIKRHLTKMGAKADVVEVGCIGLCSQEPLVDIQMPGRTRVSFGKVTAEKVPELLDAM